MAATIAVFLGANPGNCSDYLTVAKQVGREIANRQLTLLYGGASSGLMGVMADAALTAGGQVIGVMPDSLNAQEVTHTGLTYLHQVETMAERKQLMMRLADGFMILPGGSGTLEEFFEVWNAVRIGVYDKPIGMLNTNGYYDRLFHFFDQAVDDGFLKNTHRQLLTISKQPTQLIDALMLHLHHCV